MVSEEERMEDEADGADGLDPSKPTEEDYTLATQSTSTLTTNSPLAAAPTRTVETSVEQQDASFLVHRSAQHFDRIGAFDFELLMLRAVFPDRNSIHISFHV
ncbi:unnamed protein product [Lactuca saligna]|uniref:Uncharacterized protein n=1 Tax=Lactuca saligna TaxID=75948 RepID=A0AA35YZK3_LACSI|nr:unnamed protein product [Lactuca saligna]